MCFFFFSPSISKYIDILTPHPWFKFLDDTWLSYDGMHLGLKYILVKEFIAFTKLQKCINKKYNVITEFHKDSNMNNKLPSCFKLLDDTWLSYDGMYSGLKYILVKEIIAFTKMQKCIKKKYNVITEFRKDSNINNKYYHRASRQLAEL